MSDEREERVSSLPLIVGVLVALTIGYWVVSGGNGEHPAKGGKPAVGAQK